MKKLILAALIGAAAALILTGCKKELAQTEADVWSATEKAGREETEEPVKEESETQEGTDTEERAETDQKKAGEERAETGQEKAGAEERAETGQEGLETQEEAEEYPFGQEKSASETEAMVTWVRSCWTADRNAIEKETYDKTMPDSSVTVYSSGGEVKMIEAAAGYGGNSFSRIYEYRDGKLIFAFYSTKGQEYRLYFDNDSLFRLRVKINGNETVRDGAYGDADYRQWNQDCLSQGYQLYRLAAGGSADGRLSVQTSVPTDFVFRTEFKNALGNGEEYILDIFGKPDEFYKGTQGEVTDQNWYTYKEPWYSFTLRRSFNSVVEVFGNTETLFKLSKDYYTMEEVSALLGAGQNIETYEGEDVETAFAGSGETDYHCENEYYSFDFILKDGKVARDSRCAVSFSPYLCMY